MKEFNFNKTGIILGVIGIFFVPLLFGILAIICGAISKGQGNKKNGAIIIGIIDMVWGIILIMMALNNPLLFLRGR